MFITKRDSLIKHDLQSLNYEWHIDPLLCTKPLFLHLKLKIVFFLQSAILILNFFHCGHIQFEELISVYSWQNGLSNLVLPLSQWAIYKILDPKILFKIIYIYLKYASFVENIIFFFKLSRNIHV